MPSELERYRRVGRLASEAMTEALNRAAYLDRDQLAGAGASALWARGCIQHSRSWLVRGVCRSTATTPSQEPLGNRAMLVFCAGMYL